MDQGRRHQPWERNIDTSKNRASRTEARILFAEFTARDGMVDDVAALLSEYAIQVRMEPGNTCFDCCQYADNPAKFFVFETYVDEDAFQAHLAAPYGAEFNRQLAPLITEPNSILTFLRPVRTRGEPGGMVTRGGTNPP